MIPVPLIYAGAALVARFIAKRGLKAATKKFTKKAISEGKKHADDVLKKDGGKTAKKAANIKKMKPVQAANANTRATQRKSLAVGAVGTSLAGLGVAGAVSVSKKKDQQKKLISQNNKFQKQLEKERAAKRKANTAAERAKSQTSIEKLLGQVMIAEEKLKNLTAQTKKAGPPKSRPKK
tara:strand:+ start:57 stop:593 length:537 start_codon:yes stop_codon:yes gene_type:complete